MLRYALTRSGGGPRHGALLVLRLHGPEDASYCGRCIVSSLPFSRSVAFKYHTDRRNIREYCPQVSRIAYFRPFLWRNSRAAPRTTPRTANPSSHRIGPQPPTWPHQSRRGDPSPRRGYGLLVRRSLGRRSAGSRLDGYRGW